MRMAVKISSVVILACGILSGCAKSDVVAVDDDPSPIMEPTAVHTHHTFEGTDVLVLPQKDGVLFIRFEKKAEVKPRKIEIKASDAQDAKELKAA